MGKWVCECGQSMNDHAYPDKNCYRVFSDELWDKISEMTDENNNINWMDIPEETYTMYKCPKCGRLMLFGEGKADEIVFYEKRSIDS